MSNQHRAEQFDRDREQPGVPIGRTSTNELLYAGWEDMHIEIWEPRATRDRSAG